MAGMNKQWMPTVAGVLEIVAAICALVGALVLLFLGCAVSQVPDLQDNQDFPLELATGMLMTLSGLVFLGGLVCLVGGIAALRRRGWFWSMAGAIVALFLMTPAGVFALVLVILGEREFTDRQQRVSEPD